MAQMVSIVVDGSNPISVAWKTGMNVQDALETAYNQVQDASKFSFASQYYGTYQGPPYGPLGYMVVMLNGVFDLPKQGKYWALLLNGQYAKTGIDLSAIGPGDEIQFVNEPYDYSKHAETAVELRHKTHNS